MRTVAVLLSSAALIFVACSDEEGTDEPDMSLPDVGGPPPVTERWSHETIETGNFGRSPKLAISSDGVLGAAYVSTVGTNDGECTDLGTDPPPPPQVRWSIRYAEFNGSSWTSEEVANPRYVGSPPGIDLAFDGTTPLIAGMTGDPLVMFRYCGVNDTGLYRRTAPGMWMAETVVAESNEVIVNDPASDFGSVVGYWPALGVANNGDIGIAYKDVHGGGLQSDDFRKADVEFAWNQGGGWNVSAIDPTRGGGNFSEMVFDLENRPIVVQYLPTENPEGMNITGVWVHRSEDGSSWESVQIHNQPSPDGPDVTVDPTDGTVYAAYYNAQRGFPSVATLVSPGDFESSADGWEFEDVGDSRYDEGYGISVAARDGIVGVAYRRCATTVEGLGNCTANDDGLVFSYNTTGTWNQEVVDEGGDGLCGFAPSMVFTTDGSPVIIYRCEVADGQNLDTVVRVARRTSAP